MRKLTVELMGCSDVSRVDGGELDFADSGEVLRGETSRFAQMEAPLLDSFGVDDHRDMAELLRHPRVRGMASRDDAVTNSGEFVRKMSRTKRYWEELRWFERDERH
jgi:hypothetical protein